MRGEEFRTQVADPLARAAERDASAGHDQPRRRPRPGGLRLPAKYYLSPKQAAHDAYTGRPDIQGDIARGAPDGTGTRRDHPESKPQGEGSRRLPARYYATEEQAAFDAYTGYPHLQGDAAEEAAAHSTGELSQQPVVRPAVEHAAPVAGAAALHGAAEQSVAA